MVSVSVVILNWNESDWTIKCIENLLNSTFQDFEIVLVDNGSDEEDIQKIEEKFGKKDRIKIIKNDKNYGFAEGNNIGVRNSSGRYVVLLNNDVEISKDWLKSLVSVFKSDRKIAGATCNYMDRSNYSGTMSLCGFYTRYYDDSLCGQGVIPKLYVSGAWFAFDKTIIKEPFDPDYFIYCEDTYLGWLIWLKGYKVVQFRSKNPNAKAIHHSKHTLQKRKKGFSVFLGTRNRILNLLLFYEIKTLIKILPMIVISQMLYLLYEPGHIHNKLKAYLWIMLNFKRVLEKRKRIQKQRKISDKEIMKMMSCKFRNSFDVGNKIFRNLIEIVNRIFCIYCSIIRLRTVETSHRNL